jgi:threonine synthase
MNPLRLGSMKTVAYELFAQLGGRAPDWYVQAVSGGVGPVGVLAAFVEMRQAGLIEAVPRLLAVQPSGCAPMVTSWAAGRRAFDVVERPRTRVTTLGTGKPGLYPTIYDLCQQTAGSHFVAVDDDASDRYTEMLAERGIVGENTVGCAFAGLVAAVKAGVVAPEETVVFVCSGCGMGSD